MKLYHCEQIYEQNWPSKPVEVYLATEADAVIAKLRVALEVYAKQLGWSKAIDIQWVMEDKGMTAVNALKEVGVTNEN